MIFCALLWLILLIGIAINREDWAYGLLAGAIFTVIPIVLGIFQGVDLGWNPTVGDDNFECTAEIAPERGIEKYHGPSSRPTGDKSRI